MSIVNEITGEVYEIPDTTDLIEQQNKQLIADMFTEQVDEMYAQYEYWKLQKELFEHKLKEVCEDKGIQKVDTDLMKKAGVYDAFSKEVDVKESVRVKIK